jgi:hypothetical protein
VAISGSWLDDGASEIAVSFFSGVGWDRRVENREMNFFMMFFSVIGSRKRGLGLGNKSGT